MKKFFKYPVVIGIGILLAIIAVALLIQWQTNRLDDADSE